MTRSGPEAKVKNEDKYETSLVWPAYLVGPGEFNAGFQPTGENSPEI